MWPTLSDGDEVTCNPLYYTHSAPEIGDVVLLRHPFHSNLLILKRISEVQNNGMFSIVGDNPDPTSSDDSHNFGPVQKSAILGKITIK
jgi:nickel-type superoxide dismutase maturation protease